MFPLDPLLSPSLCRCPAFIAMSTTWCYALLFLFSSLLTFVCRPCHPVDPWPSVDLSSFIARSISSPPLWYHSPSAWSMTFILEMFKICAFIFPWFTLDSPPFFTPPLYGQTDRCLFRMKDKDAKRVVCAEKQRICFLQDLSKLCIETAKLHTAVGGCKCVHSWPHLCCPFRWLAGVPVNIFPLHEHSVFFPAFSRVCTPFSEHAYYSAHLHDTLQQHWQLGKEYGECWSLGPLRVQCLQNATH